MWVPILLKVKLYYVRPSFFSLSLSPSILPSLQPFSLLQSKIVRLEAPCLQFFLTLSSSLPFLFPLSLPLSPSLSLYGKILLCECHVPSLEFFLPLSLDFAPSSLFLCPSSFSSSPQNLPSNVFLSKNTTCMSVPANLKGKESLHRITFSPLFLVPLCSSLVSPPCPLSSLFTHLLPPSFPLIPLPFSRKRIQQNNPFYSSFFSLLFPIFFSLSFPLSFFSCSFPSLPPFSCLRSFPPPPPPPSPLSFLSFLSSSLPSMPSFLSSKEGFFPLLFLLLLLSFLFFSFSPFYSLPFSLSSPHFSFIPK